MMKTVLVGLISVFLLGCAKPSTSDPCQDSVRAVQALCTASVIPEVGETNESLAMAFLSVRRDVQVCVAVFNALPVECIQEGGGDAR